MASEANRVSPMRALRFINATGVYQEIHKKETIASMEVAIGKASFELSHQCGRRFEVR